LLRSQLQNLSYELIERKKVIMKIFLDDERECPAGWLHVRTPAECIHFLKNNPKDISDLSLDHDLGDDAGIGTGYDVLLWLEEKVALEGFIPPRNIIVHSSNASARVKMENAIKSIRRISDNNGNQR